MKTKDFKELCAVYTANPNLDNENILLRTMVYDYKYFVATMKYEKSNAIRLFESETGVLVLCVYTNENEVDNEIKEKYELIELTFDEIYDNVNVNNVGYILINPNTEALTLTNSQISKLYREKYYADASFPLHLEPDAEFKSRAMNLVEVNSKATSKKLLDTCIAAQTEEDMNKREKLLNEFLNEFTNYAKFYTLVLPTDEVDSIGNLVVGKDRVVYLTEDGVNGKYYLFVDIEPLEKNSDVDPENTYVSVFDFDDYIAMMDDSHGAISGLKIIGDVTLDIPANDIYHYNAIKQHNELLKDVTVLKGSYALTEEMQEIEKDFDEFFYEHPAVEKAWIGREIELYKNKKNAFVYNVVLKLSSEDIDGMVVKEAVRKILGNNLYRIYVTNEENVEPELKIIYDKSTKPIQKAVKVEKEEVKKVATKRTTTPTVKKTTAKQTASTKKMTVEKETKKVVAKKAAAKKTTATTTKKSTVKNG